MSKNALVSPLSLEERVSRLEGKVGWTDFSGVNFTPRLFAWSFVIAILSALAAMLGFGFPNHPYQVVLGCLTLALIYNKNWLIAPKKVYEWSIVFANAFVIVVIYKLFIGGGKRYPLFWIRFPNLTLEKSADEKGWISLGKEIVFSWQPSEAAGWAVDLTIIQTFLLLMTLVGAMANFQPFASLTAFLLIIISIPALFGFNWDWVFPAFILAAVSFYLQARATHVK